MLLTSNEPIKLSNASFDKSNESLTQSIASFQTQDAPFAQQFNYHLQDLEIVRRNQPLKPDGQLHVRFPDITTIDVDFNKRESIETFKERLQNIVQDKYNLKNYYLVSKNGIIKDDTTLDEYFLTPGSNVLVIKKVIPLKPKVAPKQFSFDSRNTERRRTTRPTTQMSTFPRIRKHRITPYISTEYEKQELRNKKRLMMSMNERGIHS